MQRIDQELNRTLNLNNVVDITMDWALRKSGASAGAHAESSTASATSCNCSRVLRLRAGQPARPPTGATYPADRGVIGRGIRSGQPSLVTDVSIDPATRRRCPAASAQLTVPLFKRQPGHRRGPARKRRRGRARPARPGLRRAPGGARQPGDRQRAAVPGADPRQRGAQRVRQHRRARTQEPDDQHARLHRSAAQGRGRAGQRAAGGLPEHDFQQRHAHGDAGQRPERPDQAANQQPAAGDRAGGPARGAGRDAARAAAP